MDKVTLAIIFEFTGLRLIWSYIWRRWAQDRYEKFMRRLDDDRVVTKIYSRSERKRLRKQWEMAKLEEKLEKLRDSDDGSDHTSVDDGKSRFRRRRAPPGGSGGGSNGIV